MFDQNIGTTTAFVVLASNEPNEVGEVDYENSFLYSLSSGNPNNSITIPTRENDERLFKTGRAIVDSLGNVLGVVISVQTLSVADMAIDSDIDNSRILLFSVIILILVLFLRHSRIIDYVDLYKKLKEVDQLKDDFVSMASHELRTPLSIIKGYAEFINSAPELLPETKDYVSKITISTNDLDSLVSDILDVSRIEQGRMSYQMEKVNPKEIIENVVASLTIPAGEKGLKISFDKSNVGDNQLVSIDKNRFKQNLINIVGNSVKCTKAGQIIVSQYDEKDRLYVVVSDTGIGMTEEERAGLFGKFYRIRNEETKEIRGTGLGLWITAKMINDMNGKISVESIKGVGSHFIISFPLAK